MKTGGRVLAGSKALLSMFSIACMAIWEHFNQDRVLHCALRSFEANLAKHVAKFGRLSEIDIPEAILTLSGEISVGHYMKAAWTLAETADDEAVWYSLMAVQEAIERLLTESRLIE